MARRGAAATLVSSSINRQELTAEPGANGQYVLAPAGGDDVFIIEVATSVQRSDNKTDIYPSATTAIGSILGSGSRILVEDRHLCAGQAYSLEDKGQTVLAGSVDLSRWREGRGHEDLPAIAI